MENKTLYYFREISKIPRESGNEKEIANYVVNFAKLHHLDYIIDEYNNVIIKRYIDNKEPVILQAHLDMVCEKDPDKDFDFFKDPIEVIEKDGYLMANGTTLGADNGIGVAQILNLLDEDNGFSIEAVFTVNEEYTMEGAENIDLSSLKGRTMINLDGFESDTILLECASFTDIHIHTNYLLNEEKDNLYKISLSGIDGGHSGFNIEKNKGNSNILLANFLLSLRDVQVSSFTGGDKLNVIPTLSEAIISTDLDINEYINNYIESQKDNYPSLHIEVEKVNDNRKVLSTIDTNTFLKSISEFKHGVINYNNRHEVSTSENFGIVDLDKNLLGVGLRSSNESERQEVLDYLNSYCDDYNYKLDILGFQPSFRTEEDAPLVKDLIKAYLEFNDNPPSLKSIHIGVEVGLIKEKIPDLEVVIIAPIIYDAHSPKERVNIESVYRCDEWLRRYLILRNNK